MTGMKFCPWRNAANDEACGLWECGRNRALPVEKTGQEGIWKEDRGIESKRPKQKLGIWSLRSGIWN